MTTMKAARVHAFGAPDVITLETIERPSPGADQVLVRIGAAGVGPWDGWIRAGKSVLPQPLPLTLGSDIAGTVEATGSAVTGFHPGARVFGVVNKRFTGAYAEYAVAEAAMIAPAPARLDAIEAASVPVIAVTAWQALFEQAALTRGQTVLIHGAAGNVGAFAVQLARQAGITVVATASAQDIGFVRCLGAATVIDHRAERFEAVARDIDAVVDLVGGEAQSRSFAVLKRGGRLVSAVSEPDAALAGQAGVKAGFFLVDVTTERLRPIAELLGSGKLRVTVGSVLPLAGARTAHEMLDGLRPHPRGKIVLRIGG
jgi:NADPH:quinone reductase-like Zn-dependent oxidoreductase